MLQIQVLGLAGNDELEIEVLDKRTPLAKKLIERIRYVPRVSGDACRLQRDEVSIDSPASIKVHGSARVLMPQGIPRLIIHPVAYGCALLVTLLASLKRDVAGLGAHSVHCIQMERS